MPRIRVLLMLLVVAALGCAGAAQSGSAGSSANRQNTLLREEIAASGVGNMHDAVMRLRPQYLRGRGQSSITQGADRVAVFMDNIHLGGEETLRTIAANGVIRVEYIIGTDTGFKFGTTYPGGVIHILTK